jgi:DNA mismatch endonuclease, patch repair protein
MADTWTKRKRSEVMSLVRSRGNRDTELALVHLLRKNEIKGWRRHVHLYGRPDFTFYKQRLAVFVDGCFWHRCPKHARQPKSNLRFWSKKFLANVNRDHRVNRRLRMAGWRVLRIWEHELIQKNQEKLLLRLLRALKPKPAQKQSIIVNTRQK